MDRANKDREDKRRGEERISEKEKQICCLKTLQAALGGGAFFDEAVLRS